MSDVVQMIAIAGPSRCYAISSQQGYTLACVPICCWQVEGHAQVDEMLELRVKCSWSEAALVEFEISPGCAISFRGVRTQRLNRDGLPIIELEAAPEVLVESTLRTPKPDVVVVHDEALGELRHDAEERAFCGKTLWDGQEVVLRIWSPKPVAPTSLLDSAKSLLKSREKIQPLIKPALSKHFMPIYNEDWRESDSEPELEPAAFEKIKLQSIYISKSDKATLTYDDGGIMGGHLFTVTINTRTGGIKDVSMMG